ncbi:hypothetical protein Fmac_023125 [Flemingia macrophylla]|uniref:Uncharacterized protein n=1 Tax=Flemingia macrophylla TaxID=520843 RepID=A0ABD1LKM0_9FABA
MEMNSGTSVLSDAEYEEDTFYAEIRRQILLLTSEDSDDVHETRSFNPINISNGGSNRSVYSFSSASLPVSNFSLWERQGFGSPPLWLVNLWKNGKGTGVFIPQVTCRTNQRSGRMNNNRRKIYRPVVNKD